MGPPFYILVLGLLYLHVLESMPRPKENTDTQEDHHYFVVSRSFSALTRIHVFCKLLSCFAPRLDDRQKSIAKAKFEG